jgi:hypothetical protein
MGGLADQPHLGATLRGALGAGLGQQRCGARLQARVGDQSDGVGQAVGLAPGVQPRDRETAVGADLHLRGGPGSTQPLE